MKIHYKWPFSIAMLVYQRVYNTQFPSDVPSLSRRFSRNFPPAPRPGARDAGRAAPQWLCATLPAAAWPVTDGAPRGPCSIAIFSCRKSWELYGFMDIHPLNKNPYKSMVLLLIFIWYCYLYQMECYLKLLLSINPYKFHINSI